MTDTKALRKKFGVTMKAIPCSRAFRRQMPFDHGNVDTQSFILVNDQATALPDGKPCNGSRTHVNVYNGETGIGFNADKATYDRGDEKNLKKKLKGYEECPIHACPVAVVIAE